MWVNEMMTIWLYGTIFSLLVIVVSLLVWYRPDETNRENNLE
ncbi:hypothetical protein J2S00_003607 [Caldalkalibacillus uzonensis]|uniref:Uncharacterized protein n=1 Tax=Caldalkalibacillus uzonensis TaxID=353224 RepID=A0ABU0CX45_9BACI|nr:hypothetical protein [Caldalkalibacillus uzonensis]MDQ0340767.1 hypothetical protein [Caldalkalibacillus uzonensis]